MGQPSYLHEAEKQKLLHALEGPLKTGDMGFPTPCVCSCLQPEPSDRMDLLLGPLAW